MDLPEHLLDMADRVVLYKPPVRLCQEVPGCRPAFEHAWYSPRHKQFALGDLVIEAEWDDILLMFASRNIPLTVLAEGWSEWGSAGSGC